MVDLINSKSGSIMLSAQEGKATNVRFGLLTVTAPILALFFLLCLPSVKSGNSFDINEFFQHLFIRD